MRGVNPSSSYFPTADSSRYQSAVSLDGLLQQKLDTLAGILEEVDEEIHQRSALSLEIIGETDSDYRYIKSQLLALQRWPLIIDRSFDQRRATLEHRLDTLQHAVRHERAECFRDTTRLRTERRGWLKQSRDLSQRVRLITASQQSQMTSDTTIGHPTK